MTLWEKIKDSAIIIKDMLLDFLKADHSYTLGFLFTIILGFLFELAGWWYLMLLAGGFAGFLMKKSGLYSFLVGFLGIALVWLCFFIYFMIIGPIFELTALIASLISIFESFPNLLIIITIIVGSLLGGLGALNGTYIGIMVYGKEMLDSKSEKSLKSKESGVYQ